jgi:bifunctional non-homologous end joining protein LigD
VKDVKAGPLPDFVAPTLATLVAHAPVGARRVHEIKFVRLLFQAHATQGGVRF